MNRRPLRVSLYRSLFVSDATLPLLCMLPVERTGILHISGIVVLFLLYWLCVKKRGETFASDILLLL